MKNKKYIFATMVSASLAFGAMAQENLSKEVVVEKDYVPTENKVSKPNTTAKVETIDLPKSNLKFSDWSVPTSTGNTIPVMSPYGYKTSKNFITNRGYFDFGIGSYWNMVGSAGYKIIDSEVTNLGVWLQHNSSWGYKNFMASDEALQNSKLKHIDDVIGVNFSHYFGEKQLIANGYYHFGRLNYMPTDADSLRFPFNNVNEFDLAVKFLNENLAEGLNYHAGLHYNHFGNGLTGIFEDTKAVKEDYYQLQAGASVEFSEVSRIGLDFNGELLHRNFPTLINNNPISNIGEDSDSKGLLRFNPYYASSSHNVNLRLGLNVDLSVSDGGFFHIAPDVKADLKIFEGFSVVASATGGKVMNRMSQFYAVNRYITPYEQLENSYTPLDAKAGFNVGPFVGFSAKFWMGWGRTNDFQEMRYMNGRTTDLMAKYYPVSGIGYISQDVRGWYFGGELGYSFRDIASISVNGQYANQANETGYAGMGADRPEYIIKADLQVNPIEKLKIGVGYELRGDRSVWDLAYMGTTDNTTAWKRHELKDVNNLYINAHYQINNMIGAFLNCENLLNKKWEYVQDYSAQKFNVMGGITLKF